MSKNKPTIKEKSEKQGLIDFLRWFTESRGVSGHWESKLEACVDSYLAGKSKREFMEQ